MAVKFNGRVTGESAQPLSIDRKNRSTCQFLSGGNCVPLVRGSSFRIYTTIPCWLPPRFFFPWPYQVRMFHLRFSSREGGTVAGGMRDWGRDAWQTCWPASPVL